MFGCTSLERKRQILQFQPFAALHGGLWEDNSVLPLWKESHSSGWILAFFSEETRHSSLEQTYKYIYTVAFACKLWQLNEFLVEYCTMCRTVRFCSCPLAAKGRNYNHSKKKTSTTNRNKKPRMLLLPAAAPTSQEMLILSDPCVKTFNWARYLPLKQCCISIYFYYFSRLYEWLRYEVSTSQLSQNSRDLALLMLREYDTIL